MLAIDTETYATPLDLIPVPPFVVLAAANGHDQHLWSKENVGAFREMINGECVGQNVVFDLAVLCRLEPMLLEPIFRAIGDGRMHSTDILEALDANAKGHLYIDPRNQQPIGRYSLAFLEDLYLGIDRSADKELGPSGEKPWRLRYGELDGVPLDQWPEEAKAYPLRDARGTYDVAMKQFEAGRLNTKHSAREMQAAWALKLMSVYGMRTDPDTVRDVVQRIKETHFASRAKFQKAGIVKVRFATPKDAREGKVDFVHEGESYRYQQDLGKLRELVTAAYNGDPPMTSGGKSGKQKVSTSRDTLIESGDDILEEFGEAGQNEKLFSTYVRVLEQGTQTPIHPSYNVIVSTDRTSCAMPNLQQLPRVGGIRECFVPRNWNSPDSGERWLYCSVDYAALEFVAVAQCCVWMFKKSSMADAINSGKDPHVMLAASYSGMSYEEGMRLKGTKDKSLLNLRQMSKAANYGLAGLMGAPKLVFTARKDGARFCELSGALGTDQCGAVGREVYFKGRAIPPTCRVCLDIAVRIRAAWYKQWPEMKEYHKTTIALAENCEANPNDPIVSLGVGGFLRLESSPAAASNHLFQQLAAQGAKDAAWVLSKECHTDRGSVLYGNCRPVAFLHDEILCEVREEAGGRPMAHDIAYRHRDIMIDTMQKHLPDVKVSGEPALMRRWFKSAEAVFDKAGKIKPWWPKEWSWAPDEELMKYDLAR